MKKIHIIHNRIWKRGLAGILALSLLLSCVPGLDAGATEITENAAETGWENDAGGALEENAPIVIEREQSADDALNGTGDAGVSTEGTSDAGVSTEGTGDTGVSGDSAAETPVKESSLLPDYSVTPGAEIPAYEAYKGMKDWNNAAETKALDNTYSMTIATGESAGNAVLYFVVRYKDQAGVTRSQFVFPNLDGGSRGDSILRYKAGDNLDKAYGSVAAGDVHYGETVEKEQPLASWSVQDYIFQTEVPIAEVVKVDIYLSTGKSSTKRGSIDGDDSGTQFVDSAGRLVARDGSLIADHADDESSSDYSTANSDNREEGSIRRIDVSDAEESIHAIPADDVLRYSGKGADAKSPVHTISADDAIRYAGSSGGGGAEPSADRKYKYDDFNQTFIEDKNGVFRYDAELETYYVEAVDEVNSSLLGNIKKTSGNMLYFCPEIMEFVLKKQYTAWKNGGTTPDVTPDSDKNYSYDMNTHTFYVDNNGNYKYSYKNGTYYEKKGLFTTRYFDFDNLRFEDGLLIGQSFARFDDYDPTFKEGVKYRYNPYSRIFEENDNIEDNKYSVFELNVDYSESDSEDNYY